MEEKQKEVWTGGWTKEQKDKVTDSRKDCWTDRRKKGLNPYYTPGFLDVENGH